MKKNGKPKLPYTEASPYIVDALATYICITASRYDIFTKEVDCTEIAKLYQATMEEIEAAYVQAKTMLKIFFYEKR